MPDHAATIRALRRHSNEAIDALDPDYVASFMAEDVVVEIAGGEVLRGRLANRDAFAAQMRTPGFGGYTRVPQQVIIAGEPLAGAPRAVVTLSSISSFTASVNRGDYCVAKAGLSMMTKLYAARLAEFGINVYEIQPGVIATDMTGAVKEKYDALFANGLTPINRWGTPEDVGKCVAAIAGGAFPYSTGQIFEIDGGFHLRTL